MKENDPKVSSANQGRGNPEKSAHRITKWFGNLLTSILPSKEKVINTTPPPGSQSVSRARFPGEPRYRATTWSAAAEARRRKKS